MKKLVAVLVFFVCLVALVVSSSEKGMRILTKQRYAGLGLWHSDKYLFGDLYGLSYLSAFRLPKKEAFVKVPELSAASRDIDLYVVGDSYLYSYFDTIPAYYARVAKVDFRRWEHVPRRKETFQSSRKKVVVIESVERNLTNVIRLEKIRAIFEPLPALELPWWERWNEAIKSALYHPSLESNLDFTLFNLALFSPIKQWKADWNDRVFGRTDAAVVKSASGDQLFLHETVDRQAVGSSYRRVSNDEVEGMVRNMEDIQRSFRAKGFDLIVFSFIPNPVSLLDSSQGEGNRLLARLQTAAAGRVTILDPTLRLGVDAKHYFYQSDSHWNQRGARVWLDQLNEVLRGAHL
jgi:hypothetical protein